MTVTRPWVRPALWVLAIVVWLAAGQVVLAAHLERAAMARLLPVYAGCGVLLLGGLVGAMARRWRRARWSGAVAFTALLTTLALSAWARPGSGAAPATPPDPADVAALRALPSYEFFGGLYDLAGAAGAVRLAPEQAACILSILRQGPAQYEAPATARFAAAYDATVGGQTAGPLAPSMLGSAHDEVATPPGSLLMEALTRVSRIAGQDWKGLPLPQGGGGQLQSLVPPGPPLAERLANLIVLADAGKLSKEQAEQLLPPLVGLVESADYSCKHRHAIEDQLDAAQARFVLQACRSGATPRCASIGEVFHRLDAAGYRLIGGEAPTIEGADRTALEVPYNDLLWGVGWLDRSGPDSLTPVQARQIDTVIRRLMAWSIENQILYTTVVERVHQTLRADQWTFVSENVVSPEAFARSLVTATPAGADVIGYATLRLLEDRAGVHAFAQAGPQVSADAPASSQPTLNPGSCFAAILMMEKDPRLAVTPAQARALLPYVRAASRANDVNHLVKEQIGDVLSEDQRRAIMAALAQRGPLQQMVDPKEVLAGLAQRLGGSR